MDHASPHVNGPLVIGGVGGSGTRIVAEIILSFNYYLGNDLNGPKDFLLYTLLFKRKSWFYKNKTNERLIQTGLSILKKSVVTKENLTFFESCYLINATFSMALFGHNYLGDGKGWWALTRIKKMFEKNDLAPTKYQAWGWKEPNSHLLIRDMDHFFGQFKYIHTVRHGLDMAFSDNQQQLFNWGPLFGIEIPASKSQLPLASFKYWVRANRLALEKGAQMGPERFFLLNYDQLCSDPERVIRKLIAFLKIDVNDALLKRVIKLPQVPETSGRFRKHDVSKFDVIDLNFLESLGFFI